MASRPLLICVGATKCGTSWLFDYLRSHPECALRAVKELRFFTAMDWDKRRVQAKIIADRLTNVKQRLRDEGSTAPLSLWNTKTDLSAWHPIIKAGSVDHYLDYLFNVRPEAKLVGDISPEYARLSADRFAQMARMTDDVRFLYIVREPMARFWSHIRMTARDRSVWFGTDDADARATYIARKALAEVEDLEVVESAAYGENIRKLTEAGAGRVKVMFYEELFTDDALTELCDYLGLAFMPGKYGQTVFKGPDMTFPEDLQAQAFAYLAPQYEAVRQHMGRLPQEWDAMHAQMAAI